MIKKAADFQVSQKYGSCAQSRFVGNGIHSSVILPLSIIAQKQSQGKEEGIVVEGEGGYDEQ